MKAPPADGRERHSFVYALATGLIAIAALLTAASALRRQFGHQTTARPAQVPPLPTWGELLALATGVSRGSDTGLVLLEFLDYDCAQCSATLHRIDSVAASLTTQLTVGFLHFPLTAIHPHSYEAAIAAECANQEGLFRQYHEALRARPDQLAHLALLKVADRIKLARRRFRTCLDEKATRGVIDRHVLAGRELGVRVTPTFYLNGVRVDADSLVRAIDSILVRRAGVGKSSRH